MNAFTAKQTNSQKTQSAVPPLKGSISQQNRPMPAFLHLQRMMGNQALQARKKNTETANIPDMSATQNTPVVAIPEQPVIQRSARPHLVQRQEPRTGSTETRPGTDLDLSLSIPLSVAVPEGTPCLGTQLDTLNTLSGAAQTWRGAALDWMTDFQSAVRRYAPATEGDYSRIGATVYGKLQMLDAHFGIQETLWRERRERWPMSESDSFPTESFVSFANSINPIRRAFSGVNLANLQPYCSDACPGSREGADRLGSSHPGSNTYTIFFGCFASNIAPERLTGVILHEAFHASFSHFNHDTYSFQSHYPGQDALTNADSYATFAAYAALGRDYRRFFSAAEAVEIIGDPGAVIPSEPESETLPSETPRE